MINYIPAPVIKWPIPGRLLVRIDGHLVETHDDNIELVCRVPMIEINRLSRNALRSESVATTRSGEAKAALDDPA